MNILLFGGSFNPPHLGHLFVIEQAFELLPSIDEVWLLPTYRHTFGKDLSNVDHRLHMCQLLISDLSPTVTTKTKLSTIEIDHRTSGHTYDTLQLLKHQYPNHSFSFLMGSDQLPSFTKWGNWEQLLNEMHFYVYPRAGHRYPITFPNMTLLDSPTQVITNLSSTMVRDRLQRKLSIDRLVPASILEYLHNQV